jgi:hypothetical protein
MKEVGVNKPTTEYYIVWAGPWLKKRTTEERWINNLKENLEEMNLNVVKACKLTASGGNDLEKICDEAVRAW